LIDSVKIPLLKTGSSLSEIVFEPTTADWLWSAVGRQTMTQTLLRVGCVENLQMMMACASTDGATVKKIFTRGDPAA
jgi:hypothetical protein